MAKAAALALLAFDDRSTTLPQGIRGGRRMRHMLPVVVESKCLIHEVTSEIA